MATSETSGRLNLLAEQPLSLAATRPSSHKRDETIEAVLVLADMVLVWIAAATAFHIRVGSIPPGAYATDILRQYVGVFLLYSLFVVLFCHQRGLHRRVQPVPLTTESVSVVQAITIATVVMTAFIYLAGAIVVSRAALAITVVLTYCELVGWRMARRKWFDAQVNAGIGLRNVLIVGSGSVGRALQRYIAGHRNLGLTVAGFLEAGDAPEKGEPTTVHDVLGRIEDFDAILRRHFIDEIFITVPDRRELVKSVALHARAKGIDVRVIPELYDGLACGAPIQHFGLFPTIALYQEPSPMLAMAVKRAMDVVVSAVGLLFLGPVLATAALAVRLDSAGPSLYRSERIGRKGRRFTCYKFRTMVNNAEVLKENLGHLNERKAILFKVRNDPRITRVGGFLRKYSLDELPQLWNVLKGDMSLVGPRPPVPGEYSEYELPHLKRLEVTPGITGLWQVEARQNPSFESYINLDTKYVEHWSLALDMKILLKTVFVVAAGTGW